MPINIKNYKSDLEKVIFHQQVVIFLNFKPRLSKFAESKNQINLGIKLIHLIIINSNNLYKVFISGFKFK